jgi:cyclic beta-1,2-glucan synthetase
MHRAAIEHLFGLRLHGDEIGFAPCLPSHWPEAELTLRRAGRSLRVIFSRMQTPHPDATQELRPGQTLRWDRLGAHTTCLMRLIAAPPLEVAAASAVTDTLP